MVQRSLVPFNVSLLDLTPNKLAGLKPVTVSDTFDSPNVFHENGLFSPSIFGKVGDERRSMRFSYIDIKATIFHPIVFKALLNLKGLYGEIMAGSTYALWDESIKDFVKSNAVEGETGYYFFVSKWKEIEFKKTGSDMREQYILMVEKYKEKAMVSKIVVMPAGMRDLEITTTGRREENEINPMYRKLISASNMVTESAIRYTPETLNNSRYTLQVTFNCIYDLVESMIKGKKKFIMNKWASRTIMNGTRNVLTAMDTSSEYLGAPGAVNINNTIIGLYQLMKSVLPVSIYQIRNGFLSSVFSTVDAPAKLVNMKTRKMEEVELDTDHYDRWMSNEGLEKVIESFGEENLRDKPLIIDGRYLGLIYKGPDKTFKIIHDIDDVPGTRSKLHVYPLTFCELLYLSFYRVANNYPMFFTRYPITGIKSCYPSMSYLKTTVEAEVRKELDDNWEPMDDSYIANEFPIAGAYVNSLTPHSSRLEGLTADFDGDVGSSNILYSDEAVKEIKDFLASKRAYVGSDNKFMSSVNVHTVALMLRNMTFD